MSIIPGFMLSLASSSYTGHINNQYARENAAAQREWQRAMWHEENAYNTPSAMAQRMREAGLNPYTMTGAEPAGSVGTGSQAQTIPFENPMANLTQVAQVENLASSTDKNLNESDRILLQIERDKVALQMELITKEEYEFRFKKYQEAYAKLNPFTLEAENKQADTAFKNASASSATADVAVKESQDRLNEANILQTMNSIDIANKSLSLEERRTYFEELKTYSQLAVNEATFDNLKTKNDIDEFYRRYVQPLEAQTKRIGVMIENENLKGTRIENRYKEILADAEELQLLLSKGDARGFHEYINYYLQSVIGLSNVGTKLAGVFAK